MNSRIQTILSDVGARVANTAARPWFWIPLVFLVAGGIGFGIGSWRNLCVDCPSIAQIHTWEPQQTSKVFSRDGRLVDEFGIERRTPVSIDALPEHVPQAFIAIEDRRFYDHRGFDPWGIARAVVVRAIPRPILSLTGRSFRAGGGSTITQQLARNMFEAIGFDVTIDRKLKELQVALELEGAYSKDRILEAYMNEIYLGPGWWGIQTASQNYFGKDAIELNPAEAAMLASVANNATLYSPFRNPDMALGRRNLVLDRMAREGFLTDQEAQQWQEHPLPDTRARAQEGIARYYLEAVRQEAQARVGNQLYTGGLQIYTNLDIEIQEIAERVMERGFERIEGRPEYPHPRYAEYMEDADPSEELTNAPYVQGAFVASDPHTGAVLALVGGRDFEHSRFDRARQARRQAGSAFKTFVYASALANGIPASHILVDGAVVFPQGNDDPDWSPRNFTGEFDGEMTLREAYRRSINTVATSLGNDDVGLETVAQTARRLGIRSTPIQRVPSMPIGSPDVLPIEIAEAYSALAALGVRTQLSLIRRIENAEGEVVWEPQPERTPVLDPLSARLIVHLMEDVVNAGTAYNAIRNPDNPNGAGLPYNVPAAGKTGTTNNSADVWFAGFTPSLQATVWFGMDRPQRIRPNATGGGDAAPVWGEFMRQVYVGDVFDDPAADNGEGARPVLPVPERWSLEGLTPLEVDNRTGLLASDWCPEERRYTEYFIPGTEPTEECDDGSRGPGLRWPW